MSRMASKAVPKLLVVGGNGYLGSSVCKAAVAKGWHVESMSSSGKPYATPAGHTPKWVNSVQWHKASAFEPSTFADLLKNQTAIVHTLGILLEDAGYKQAVAKGDAAGLAGAVAKGVTGSGAESNPLRTSRDQRKTYEGMNREAAWSVLDTWLKTLREAPTPQSATASSAAPSSPPSSSTHTLESEMTEPPLPEDFKEHPSAPQGSSSTPPKTHTFVYISAADIGGPIIPARYVSTKREAEAGIVSRCEGTDVLPVLVRPGIMYNAHTRPISTVPAFALSITAGISDTLGIKLPFAKDSFFGRAQSSLITHPLHVDHVADAIIKSIEEGKEGVVDVDMMRRWAGFKVPERH